MGADWDPGCHPPPRCTAGDPQVPGASRHGGSSLVAPAPVPGGEPASGGVRQLGVAVLASPVCLPIADLHDKGNGGLPFVMRIGAGGSWVDARLGWCAKAWALTRKAKANNNNGAGLAHPHNASRRGPGRRIRLRHAITTTGACLS